MSLIGLFERAWYLFHKEADVAGLVTGRLQSIRKDPSVLDLGGGTGRVSSALAPRFGGVWNVADIDDAALSRVPREATFRTTLLKPGEILPFPDGAFDAVLVVDVLHHVEDQALFLGEAVRCLRCPGLLLIVEFDRSHWLVRLFGGMAARVGAPCHFWTPGTLGSRLEQLGLRAITRSVDSLRFLAEGLSGPRFPSPLPASARPAQ